VKSVLAPLYRTGNNESYSSDDITNITRDSSHIRFSLVHTWAGPSRITIQCLHNAPQEFEGTLADIVNYVPQYNRSDFPGMDHAKFREVCLKYEKFLYFVQIMGERPAVPFDDESLRFEMLKWPLDAYLKHKNVNMTHAGGQLCTRNFTQRVNGGDLFVAWNRSRSVTRGLFKCEILRQFGAADWRTFYQANSKSATWGNAGAALHSEIPIERQRYRPS
jgi:hypothetical protein